jgi:hypothetical protein
MPRPMGWRRRRCVGGRDDHGAKALIEWMGLTRRRKRRSFTWLLTTFFYTSLQPEVVSGLNFCHGTFA